MCSIVPLSTTPPKLLMKHHMLLTLDPPLPRPYDTAEMWVKGDIVLTIGFHRIRLLFSKWKMVSASMMCACLMPNGLKLLKIVSVPV